MDLPTKVEIELDLNQVFNEFRNTMSQLFENFYAFKKSPISSSSLVTDDLTQTSETEIHFSSQINQFYTFLQEFFQKIIETWSNQVLPEFYDIVIEIALSYAKRFRKDPIFPLNIIYNFFYLIGMRNILVKTIKRITGALQWSIVSTTWVNIPFWLNIYDSFSNIAVEKDAKEALKEMIVTAQFMEADELRVSRTLSDLVKKK